MMKNDMDWLNHRIESFLQRMGINHTPSAEEPELPINRFPALELSEEELAQLKYISRN